MEQTRRDDLTHRTQPIIEHVMSAGCATLSNCLVDLLRQANDPKVRNDPKARDLYTRYDTLDAFQKYHKKIIKTCLEEVKNGFLNPPSSNYGHSQLNQHDSLELDVIEPDEVELANLVFPLAEQLEKKFHESLLHLELRLEALRNYSLQSLNPIGWHPQALFNAFQRSINPLSIKLSGKYLLCEFFQVQLTEYLTDFYTQANGTLVKGGFLKDKKSLENAIYIKQLEQDDSGISENLTPRHSGRRQANQSSEIQLRGDLTTSHLNTPTSLLIDPTKDNSSIDSPESIEDRFIDMLLAPNAPGTGSTLSPYQRAQIAMALSTIQRKTAADDTPPDTEEIKTATKRILYDSGIFNASELVDNESKAIDFVGDIFLAIREDNSLSKVIKTLIAKLQIPTIKIAFLDFEFFKNPNHPARGVLNRLTTLGVGVADTNDSLYAKLESIVLHILQQFHTEISVFEQALSGIRALALSESKKIQKIEEKSQIKARQDAKRTASRKTVTLTINLTLKGKKTPKPLTHFVRTCWAPYMQFVHLNQGAKSKIWKDAVRTLIQLIESSQPSKTRQQIDKIVGKEETFFSSIKQRVTKVPGSHQSSLDVLVELRKWFKEHKIKSRDTTSLRNATASSKQASHENHKKIESAATKNNGNTSPRSHRHQIKKTGEEQKALGDIKDKKAQVTEVPTQTELYDDEHGIEKFDEMPSKTESNGAPSGEQFFDDDHGIDELDSTSQSGGYGTLTTAQVEEEATKQESIMEDLQDKLPPYVKPGTWFEVFQAEGKAKRRLKLSTILEDTGQILFANRIGEGEITIDIETFINDLKEGYSKPINDSNLFDRALSSVISNIRKSQSQREF